MIATKKYVKQEIEKLECRMGSMEMEFKKTPKRNGGFLDGVFAVYPHPRYGSLKDKVENQYEEIDALRADVKLLMDTLKLCKFTTAQKTILKPCKKVKK